MNKKNAPNLYRPIKFFRKKDHHTLVSFKNGLKGKDNKKTNVIFSKEYYFLNDHFKDFGLSLVKIRLFFPEIQDYPITTNHPLFGEYFYKVYFLYELGEEKFDWEYMD
ncbi:hypothetical protein COB11_08450 [Candidatus Aerophobetes bacterium]|uniref:Uncharacterized protein n=1 Tax=Aerophobetes bacterium TaxID=2030807 RepID=A0A2A4YAG5_UNCAE|nr:MAG: hypothetical protein COB11_08450 [Candidatus Aerophobetes bacterium]